jgi:hypothetical protein
MEVEFNLQNIILNGNKMMDNVQKVNHSITVLSSQTFRFKLLEGSHNGEGTAVN